MLRQSPQIELDAAAVLAAKAGLGRVIPTVLHLGNHTSARLSPWPIVARIASGTSFDFADDSLLRELTIAAHLARHEAPSVRPARSVAPGPYFYNQCAVTFWEFAEGRIAATEADTRMAAASLRKLHSFLADIDADLPSFITKIESCETILESPDQAPRLAPSERRFLLRLYRRLRADLRGIDGRFQPLHGDAHLANVLIAGSDAIWMDLESVCVGPLEWDVGFLPREACSEFSGLDFELMRLLAAVRSLCVATWCWAEFDRSPATKEAAHFHLSELKRRFG